MSFETDESEVSSIQELSSTNVAFETDESFLFKNNVTGELKLLLQVPIIPRSVSMTYPTRDENHRLLDSLKGNDCIIIIRL